MNAPGLWSLAWSHWELAPGLDGAAALALAAYLAAARRIRGGWPALRSAAFAAGLGAILLATQSGFDAFDDRMLSAHMVQHLLLLELAPLLLLGGRPAMLLLRAAPPRRRPAIARALRRASPLTRPLVCLGLFSAVVLGAHVPAFFDATIRHPLLHDGEHATFLLAGVALWWPVLDGDPIPGHRLDGLRRLAYVVAAMVPMTLVGAWLDRDQHVVYAVYAAPARVLHISAVADQQRAGAIMWVLGSVVMVVAGLWQTMAALRAEERALVARERRLDAAAVRELS